jgi:hypothetical protein
MATLYQERSQFEKLLLAALGNALRGSRWRKSGNQVYASSGEGFVSFRISVHRNDQRTGAVLSIKPMGLDPILWDILGLEKKQSQSLSFRALGAFTCDPLPVFECDVEQPGQSPEQVAGALVQTLEANCELCESRLRSAKFSELVAAHPNQVLRGAYAITLVTSLIREGDELGAFELARAYAQGTKSSCVQMTSMGMSFHDLAARWD